MWDCLNYIIVQTDHLWCQTRRHPVENECHTETFYVRIKAYYLRRYFWWCWISQWDLLLIVQDLSMTSISDTAEFLNETINETKYMSFITQCCIVFQCVATCFSVLQHVAVSFITWANSGYLFFLSQTLCVAITLCVVIVCCDCALLSVVIYCHVLSCVWQSALGVVYTIYTALNAESL